MLVTVLSAAIFIIPNLHPSHDSLADNEVFNNVPLSAIIVPVVVSVRVLLAVKHLATLNTKYTPASVQVQDSVLFTSCIDVYTLFSNFSWPDKDDIDPFLFIKHLPKKRIYIYMHPYISIDDTYASPPTVIFVSETYVNVKEALLLLATITGLVLSFSIFVSIELI